MKSPEQLKGAVRVVAQAHGLRAQEVLQMALFEQLLARLAQSPYRDAFVLKGGLLIASMLGIQERTTMDMDTTVRGIAMTEDEVMRVLGEICAVDVGDGITMRVERLEPIRKDSAYSNFRAHVRAEYGRIQAAMKIDITTGDIILPSAIRFRYQCLFDDATIPVMAYTLESILAEKFIALLSLNIATTRARDFYDVYVLMETRGTIVRPVVLRKCAEETARKHAALEELHEWREVLEDMRATPALAALWAGYARDNGFAAGIAFEATLDAVQALGELYERGSVPGLGVGAMGRDATGEERE
jgi:predicted nucleotidyltransferase component of viral defense system